MVLGQDRVECPDCRTVVQRKNIKAHYRRLHPGKDPVKRMREAKGGSALSDRKLSLADAAGMVLAVMAVFILIAAGVLFITKLREGESKGRPPRSFFFASDDGAVINGTFYPAAEDGAPTVYLYHDIGQDRTVFSEVAPWLVKQGYNVVALDLRGHGESIYNVKTPNIKYDHTMMGHKDFLNFQRDLLAAQKWVSGLDEKGRPNTDAGKESSFLGLGKGGLYGFDQAARMTSVRMMSAVVISPTLDCYDLDVAQAAENWGGIRPVLFVASDGDGSSMGALDVMMARRPQNGRELVLPGTQSALEILESATLRRMTVDIIEDGIAT
ncbi:MAG: alpha/beta hydrolase [Candidatus Thermoplasmatota archaeon]|jgi:pimeloyl-ACP methyl ester carboxylesterase|nr:alpha/beta hydrolase [Candidatus Thermoplasmatota archaeon]